MRGDMGDFEALYYGEMLVDIGNALVHLDEPKDAIEEYLLTIGRHATLIVIHHQDMGIRDVHDNMGLETAIYGSAELPCALSFLDRTKA